MTPDNESEPNAQDSSNVEAPPVPKEVPPHMKPEALKQFVKDYLGGLVFTDCQIKERDMQLIPMIFLPVALGGLQNVDLRSVGCVWEYSDKAGPRAVNGYPMFTSCRLMHVDDWARARVAINRELDRLKDIEV